MSKFTADVIENDSGQAFLVVSEYDEEALKFFDNASLWEERARWYIKDNTVVLNFLDEHIILGYN